MSGISTICKTMPGTAVSTAPLINISHVNWALVTPAMMSRASPHTTLPAIIDMIRDKHLRLIIQGSITMDCRTNHPDPMTEAFLQIAGVFAQLELAMIRARVKSGMENARAKGKHIGRPETTIETIPDRFLRYYALYKNHDLSISELARLAGVSRPTVYKYIRLIEH